jgi:hypothetical protein
LDSKLLVEGRKAPPIGGIQPVLLAEVQVKTQPLEEMRAQFHRDALFGEKRAVTLLKFWFDRQHGSHLFVTR